MPRKPVPISSTLPYHVTARTDKREPFPIDMQSMWSLMGDYLFLIEDEYSLEIRSFVLMPNHFHLLISCPDGNLSAAMAYFMRETSKEVHRLAGTMNHTYGNRHHKCLIESNHYFMNAYKYVYRNPVRAGLCDYVEEYPFSTLGGLVGQTRLIIPTQEDTILFNTSFDQKALDWLNRTPDQKLEAEVRAALKHRQMKFVRDQIYRRPSALETSLL